MKVISLTFMFLFFYGTVPAQDTVPIPRGSRKGIEKAEGFIKDKVRLRIRPELRLYYGLSSPVRYSPSEVNNKFQLDASYNSVYGIGTSLNLRSNRNTFGFEAAMFQQEITVNHDFFEVVNYSASRDRTPSFNFYKFIIRYGRKIELSNKLELVPEFTGGIRYFPRAYFSQTIYFTQSQSTDLFNERYFNNTQNQNTWLDIGFGASIQRRIFKNQRLSLGLTTSFVNRPFAKGDYYYNFNNQNHIGNTENKLNYLSVQLGFIF